ncbi:putative nucleoprotein [Hubei odonate virus 9]|uniref:Putative nucleoprotein n=1 Tax=Hubei odonate virus 9 TaxID=1923004 RepID=A0A1L3KPH6_9VIRU|nr:putative nucleoprotein [Hubei odonate virus 9]APG79277.1 putative nucleoprotein [Hubei odonate virus 9]
MEGVYKNRDAAVETAKVKPGEIASHTIDKEYMLEGLTPGEAIDLKSSSQFDMNALIDKFRNVCADYQYKLDKEKASFALDFAVKMLYEVGPSSRSKDKADHDKVSRFVFPITYKDDDDKYDFSASSLFVCTFKKSSAKSIEKFDTPGKMIATIKQANLLAMHKMNQLTDIACSLPDPRFPIVPLAGAVFSKDDIVAMSNDLREPTGTILKEINSSSISGGHFLEESTLETGAICAIAATKNIRQESVRHSIIGKIVKQYHAAGKQFNPHRFQLISKYAHGGVPAEMNPASLIQTYDSVRMSAVQIAAVKKADVIGATGTKPGHSKEGNK